MDITKIDFKNAETAFVCVGTQETACRFYAYKKEDEKYTLVFETDGYIGRSGIHPASEKFEGDGKTPEGVYSIGECFGNTLPPCEMKVPYTLILGVQMIM